MQFRNCSTNGGIVGRWKNRGLGVRHILSDAWHSLFDQEVVGRLLMRYRVMVKKSNAYQAWTVRGTYGSEAVALSMAQRLSRDYAFVRVVDQNGQVLWSR